MGKLQRLLIAGLLVAIVAAVGMRLIEAWLARSLNKSSDIMVRGRGADDPGISPHVEGEPLIAWVLDTSLQREEGQAVRLLEEAGFEVRPLPLDQPPIELKGMIYFASSASELPEYQRYLERYAESLRRFVRRGNVLVQMAQSPESEPMAYYLDEELRADRVVRDPVEVVRGADGEMVETGIAPAAGGSDRLPMYVITAGTRILEGVPAIEGRLTAWENAGAPGVRPFLNHFGFEVVLATDPEARHPALMQATSGRGRVLLSQLPLDQIPEPPPGIETPEVEEHQRLVARFYQNLYGYTLDVRRGQAQRLRMTPPPESADFVPGSWSLVVLPDTQHYSESFPGTFHLQTDWIARNAGRRNVKYVLHVGDVVNRNTRVEWTRARAAMRRLDGIVPYAIAPGNHDYGPGGDATTRETLFNEYFPYDQMASFPGFGGAMEPGKLDNTYHLFEAGGRKWIVLALEWGPRDETLAWAGRLMEEHADRVGILITHAFLNYDGTRQDYPHASPPTPEELRLSPQFNPHEYGTEGGVNDGEQIWQKLVRKYNFALVLSGHVTGGGAAYLGSRNDTGTVTHQIIANYQRRDVGGGGYLRVMEFLPDGQTVRVRTYSPLYDHYLLEPGHQFKFRLQQPGAGIVSRGPAQAIYLGAPVHEAAEVFDMAAPAPGGPRPGSTTATSPPGR